MAVLGFDEALEAVRRTAAAAGLRVGAQNPGTEQLDLLPAQGRVLAQHILAERDQPPFNRSTRDGYAVVATSLMRAGAAGLHLFGELRAGQQWDGAPVQPGEAVAIMTGAPLPPGADAVVMLEHVQRDRDQLTLDPGRTLRSGDNVVARGAEAHSGDVLLSPGKLLDPAALALAASCGQATIEVYTRPLVAIVATGDELVELAESPKPWQIRNSNSYALAALVAQAGGRPERLPIARDRREEIRERMTQARFCDLLLLSGGVSMGAYDLVEEVLAELGAQFFFTGVRMQPGRPVVFGRLPPREGADGPTPECLFFGLPGNPVSTEVTFHCFVKPLLRVLGGEPWPAPTFVQATLAEDVAVPPGLTRLLPASLTSTHHHPKIRLERWQGSGDLASNARANCYALFPEGTEHFPADSIITALMR